MSDRINLRDWMYEGPVYLFREEAEDALRALEAEPQSERRDFWIADVREQLVRIARAEKIEAAEAAVPT